MTIGFLYDSSKSHLLSRRYSKCCTMLPSTSDDGSLLRFWTKNLYHNQKLSITTHYQPVTRINRGSLPRQWPDCIFHLSKTRRPSTSLDTFRRYSDADSHLERCHVTMHCHRYVRVDCCWLCNFQNIKYQNTYSIFIVLLTIEIFCIVFYWFKIYWIKLLKKWNETFCRHLI